MPEGKSEIPAAVMDAAVKAYDANPYKGMAIEKNAAAIIVVIAKAILAERSAISTLLKDPSAVRINYLRGDIACQVLIDEAVIAERQRCADLVESFSPGGENYEYGHDDASMRVAIRGAILSPPSSTEER